MASTPHDSLFKAAFGPPEHAAGILRKILPKAVAKAILWPSLRLEPGSFVDPDLAQRHSDLLFSAHLRGHPIKIYVLFEHQSGSCNDMPLRMLSYLVRVWERLQKESPQGPLPIILPVVLSHDPGGFRGPTHLWDMLEPNPAGIAELAGLVPSLKFVLEDVSQRSDAEIRALALPPFPTLSIVLMRDVRTAAKLSTTLKSWASDLVALLGASSGEEILVHLLTYIASVDEELDLAEIRGKLAEIHPRVEEIAVTIAEKMRDEGFRQGREEGLEEGHKRGREEGHKRGREEGQRNALTKLLSLRFEDGPDAQQLRMIQLGTPEQLERWIEAVLTASSINEVLLDN